MGKQPHPAPKTLKENDAPEDQPPPEEEFGGGDFCSPEPCPPTEDDRPLD